MRRPRPRAPASALAAVLAATLAAWAPVTRAGEDVPDFAGPDFAGIAAWRDDGQAEALAAFRTTCDRLEEPAWRPLCALAADVPRDDASARAFFEIFFRPVPPGAAPALFTGYYEPVLEGSLRRSPRFAWPIYRRPPELRDGTPYLTRAVIDGGALSGRGLEIAWLEDPNAVFNLQMQGSGRIRLEDGTIIRVGYAGRNGHGPGPGALGIAAINPSYVFFRRIDRLPPGAGPIGAMGRPLTPLRSIAVDPAHVPLGAPVWIETAGRTALNRLMVAQDTGGAIKGPQRADIFFGSGARAGKAAGTTREGGRMLVLLPIDLALAPREGP